MKDTVVEKRRISICANQWEFYPLAYILVLFFPLVLFFVPLRARATTQVSTAYDSQSELEDTLTRTGLDTSTSPGDMTLLPSDVVTSPATNTETVAVLVSNDASMNADLEFLLEAYFPNFTFDGSGSDDVFSYSSISSVADLAGYDIVITNASTISQADAVPQDIVEAFADTGKTVVQGLLEYARQRQADTYPSSSYDNSATTSGDIAYDGTYLWQIDDTSPERLSRIEPSNGTINATYCAPNVIPRSLTFVAGTLYIVDSYADKLYAIDPANLTPYDGVCASPAQGTIYNLSDLSPTATSPWGLTYDGTYFWLVDSLGDRLYSFTISGGSLVQNSVTDLVSILKPAPSNPLPRGMGFDGTYLWYADATNNLIYQISATSTSVVGALDPRDDWSGYTDTDPTGIAFVNGNMWVVDTDPSVDKLYDITNFHTTRTSFEYFNRSRTSIRTPGDDPKGMDYDGTYLWVVDDTRNTIEKITTSGTVVDSCISPDTRPYGIAYNSGTLYVSGSTSDKVYLMNASDCSITASYNTPSTSPRGITYDGTYLWIGDSASDTIYKLNASTGAVISSFSAPGPETRGLTYRSGSLWISDSNDDLYYEIDPSTGTVLNSRTQVDIGTEGIVFIGNLLWSIDPVQARIHDVSSGRLANGLYDTPASDSEGFTYDGTFIWAVDSGTDRLYKLAKADFSIITSYATPALDPRDITWDGTNLWMTTDSDNKIYKVNPSDGSVISSFSAPASDPTGIVYANTKLYVSDPMTNKIYEMQTDGTVLLVHDAPGSASGPLAYDGTDIWNYDTDEMTFYKLFLDDITDTANEVSSEGSSIDAIEATTTRIRGIEYIDGVLWSSDYYFDSFFNQSSLNPQPTATITTENTYTSPYKTGDAFYFSSRDVSDAMYLHRRITGVTTNATREVLATSNRGGAVYIHETRTNGGNLFAIDMNLIGKNYEISRQTIPANTLFLDALGIQINSDGEHENTRPSYSTLLGELQSLATANPGIFTQVNQGTASDGSTIYAFDFGTAGKPIVVLVSGVHGNEEHAYIPLVRYAQKLVSRYNANDTIARNIFENYYVKIIPFFNPYGIKNGKRYNANGIDLNRNYDHSWSALASSTKGASPFSEPETVMLRDYILANRNSIIYVNDAHSSMGIAPGFIYGDSLALTDPGIITDTQEIQYLTNIRRWYEERSGVGHWVTYDHYKAHTDKPYLANWVTDQGINAATNEVMGKKDIGTERMIYTSSWYFAHYDALFKALSEKTGKAIYRIDTGNNGSTFASAISSTQSTPASSTVTFRYASNSVTTTPTTWSATYDAPSANRYLFVEVTLKREAYDTTTPTLNAFTAQYSMPSTRASALGPDDLRAPRAPEGGFVVLINNGESVTHDLEVTLVLDGGDETKRMRVSNEPNLLDVPERAYKPKLSWRLADDGSDEKIVYVKFLNHYGASTKTLSDSIYYEPNAGDTIRKEDEITIDSELGIKPTGVTEDSVCRPGDLIKLIDDNNPKTQYDTAVYYCGQDLRRYVFPNETIYFSWFHDFNDVKTIPQDRMALLPVGGNVTYRPNGALIIFQSSPDVYELLRGRRLRYVSSEDRARALRGKNWKDTLASLPVTTFTEYRER